MAKVKDKKKMDTIKEIMKQIKDRKEKLKMLSSYKDQKLYHEVMSFGNANARECLAVRFSDYINNDYLDEEL